MTTLLQRLTRLGGLAVLLASGVRAAPDLATMMEERLAAVVAIEFTIVHELDRTVNFAYGVVIDGQGTIILEPNAISGRATPEQMQDFRVYRPDRPVTEYAKAEYLGQDGYSTWHYVRVAPEGRTGLRPITDFLRTGTPVVPRVAEEVWGIGLRKKDEDFRPYFMAARVSLVQELPQLTAIALGEVSGRGLPVFNLDGEFIGLGASGFGENVVIYSSRRRGELSVLVNPDECAAFRCATEVLLGLGRVPDNPYGRPLPWFGVDGIDPVDPEVAEFLGLGAGTGLVVSEVLEGSPAQTGGLMPRDIIVAVDGLPLPRLKPDQVVAAYLQREILRRRPGTSMALTVLRDRAELELTIDLIDAPKTPQEAQRRYHERLGVTAREWVYTDAVQRRTNPLESTGVIAHFVKPSSPVATAGLQMDDWIKEIDGTPVADFAQADSLLGAIETSGRSEAVLLVSRGGETAVLRVKLD